LKLSAKLQKYINSNNEAINYRNEV